MFLVVEGLNGVGKSTLVDSLKPEFGFKELRPFRAFRRGHWGSGGHGERLLRRIGVPFNSIHEDMFCSDFVASSGSASSFIMDRSVPSALAYGGNDRPYRDDAYKLWFSLLEGVDVRYLWMQADHGTASARLDPDRRLPPERHAALLAVLEEAFALIPWPRLAIDTTDKTKTETHDLVSGWLRRQP